MVSARKTAAGGRRRGQSRVDDPGVSDDFTVPGDGLDPGEDVAVAMVEEIAVLRPASFDRLDEEARGLADQLMVIVGRRRQLALSLEETVTEAREAGLSWGQIGWCVGTSAQAAHRRWGDAESSR